MANKKPAAKKVEKVEEVVQEQAAPMPTKRNERTR